MGEPCTVRNSTSGSLPQVEYSLGFRELNDYHIQTLNALPPPMQDSGSYWLLGWLCEEIIVGMS